MRLDLKNKTKYDQLKSQPNELFEAVSSDLSETEFTRNETLPVIITAHIILESLSLEDLKTIPFPGFAGTGDGTEFSWFINGVKAILQIGSSDEQNELNKFIDKYCSDNYTSLIHATSAIVLAHSYLYGIQTAFNIDQANQCLEKIPEICYFSDSGDELYDGILKK